MNRRAFLGALATAVAVPFLPSVPFTSRVGTIGDITRSSYAFWSNQQATGAACASLDLDAMRRIYNQCSIGGQSFTPSLIMTTKDIYRNYKRMQ